ncbi:MAG: hypothetical protein RLZZ385_43 [Pseudomonadota bacterium]
MVLAMILFMAGSSYIIAVLGSNDVERLREADAGQALLAAREAVIAFAVMHGDYYGAAGTGPGHLFCPDTNNNGQENTPCAGNALGRLPQSVTLPSGDVFRLSDYGVSFDQQIWYAVAPAFKRAPAGILNTSINGNLTLDGQTGIAVVLMAPGAALLGQNRSSNTAGNYLESANTTLPDFTLGSTLATDSFNDRVLAIRSSDIHTPVSSRVAERVRVALAAYHTANGAYPPSQATFTAALAVAGVMPAWYAANGWPGVTTYTQINANTATVQFTGCAITYTLTSAATALARSANRC